MKFVEFCGCKWINASFSYHDRLYAVRAPLCVLLLLWSCYWHAWPVLRIDPNRKDPPHLFQIVLDQIA